MEVVCAQESTRGGRLLSILNKVIHQKEATSAQILAYSLKSTVCKWKTSLVDQTKDGYKGEFRDFNAHPDSLVLSEL